MDIKRELSIGAVVLLIVAAVFLLYRERKEVENTSASPSPSMPVKDVPSRVTLEGEYVCLPKKGDGPHTLECALGLKANDGNYYALTMSRGIPDVYNIPTGSRIKVAGMFVPIEQISTDMWKNSYDIRGIISVEVFEVK